MDITVIVENTVAFPFSPGVVPGLCGEHGLALMIDHPAGRFLYDTGRGKALLPNLETLGISPDSFDGVVLSHAHLDHFGALGYFLERRHRPVDLYLHPDAFAKRYTRIGDGFRPVGLPWVAEELQRMGAVLHFTEGATRIAEGLWVTGAVARQVPFEVLADDFYRDGPNGRKVRDEIPDDQAMLIETEGGLVVLTGCAHAGVCNILEAAKGICPGRPVRAVLGGLHLEGAPAERMDGTVAYLQGEEVSTVAVGHCTGFSACCKLAAGLPGRFVPLNTGMAFSF